MYKIKLKMFVIIALTLLNILHISVFANNDYLSNGVVSSVTRLDVSKGVIIGLNADYFFLVPKDIRDMLVVDRAILKDSTMALEKLDFYCASYSQKYKPAPLMSLYIFEKRQWNEAYNLKFVSKSKDYVFAAKIIDDTSFTQTQDKAFYTYCRSYLGSAEAINNLISLPKSQLNLFDNTVFINGKPLEDKVKIVGGVYYLPIRAIFEYMDYDVTWNSSKNSVELSKDTFKDSFTIKNGRYSGVGYSVIIVNGRSYISTSYFLKILATNIEIDEANNVYILLT